MDSFNANLNDAVFAKLSKTGWDVLNDRYDKDFLPEANDEGYVEFVLWEFMGIFGGLMYHGNAHPPFDMNFKIVKRS